jgi:hypothetical protein
MLRWLVLLLMLANLAYWGMHQPEIAAALGLPDDSAVHSGAIRQARQIHPEAARLLSPAQARQEAMAAADAASAATREDSLVCLQSVPLNDAEHDAMQPSLAQAGLAPGEWVDVRREFPGRWAVLMGRFSDRDAMRRKAEELKRMHLNYEDIPADEPQGPALLLGQFSSEVEAKARLNQLSARGVRTAKAVVLSPPRVEHRLRVEALTTPQSTRLQDTVPAGHWSRCTD